MTDDERTPPPLPVAWTAEALVHLEDIPTPTSRGIRHGMPAASSIG
jgi:hypothetical protein